MKIEAKFAEKSKQVIEKYYFEVGILEAKKHLKAKRGQLRVKGNRTRSKVSTTPDKDMQALGSELQGRYGWLTKPFEDYSSEILNWAKSYIAEIQKPDANENRLNNLAQAIVRNPILRGDYGVNKDVTAKVKGFNTLMIDTGQFFDNVKARIIRNV